MRHLIWKEFFLQRKVFILYLILPIYCAIKQFTEPFQIAIVCFITCLLMIASSLSIEDKNKTEKILVSLPFVRKDIVIAKYISTILFIGCGWTVTFAFVILPKFLLNENTNIPWYAVFIAIFLSILYAMMVLPVKYGGNKQAVTIFSILVLFPLIGLLGFMCNVFAEKRLMIMFFHSSNLEFIISILSIGACIAYFISMFLSIGIFGNKEL
ncbi:ABC-2 transporter permease [Bacillus sp. DX1.1]|uniref:ABC-2 transporter permease n=1 Tax=unclassified Bacillus (in: firmicutes) TaxID=185979 RepID=UPI0025704DF8|nr:MULTISPECIES: ABC-2 transporter permease [unclassified Bacillus (in: firmicutes)]MDM5156419.1 ABC-2 transporter permease [Bacillus sp. DX1.1]WJE80689.1 ABC-2 transporter permease [Bacillus sp. DX3.1]